MYKYQDVIILNNNLQPEEVKGIFKRCKVALPDGGVGEVALPDGGVGELELAYIKAQKSKYKMYELSTGLFCIEENSIKLLDNLLEAGFGIRIYESLNSPHMDKYRDKILQYKYNKLIKVIKKGLHNV